MADKPVEAALPKNARARFCFGVLVIILGGSFTGAVVTSWLLGNVDPFMATYLLLVAFAMVALGARAIAEIMPNDF